LNRSHHLALALSLACGLVLPALAQEPTFFNESKPMFDNCGDGSLAKAQKDGITLGFSQAPPEAFLDEKTKQPSGVDWEINKAVLNWLGVTKINIVWMPWESQIPALLSKRTDVIAGNIHHTPARDKVITFSGPAWWYGPVIVAGKGNPLGIKSYDDLKGKRVGSISGSAADDYLRHIGVTTMPFKVAVDELQASTRAAWMRFSRTTLSISISPRKSPTTRSIRCGSSRCRTRSSTAAATAWPATPCARKTARYAPATLRAWPRSAPTVMSATS